MATCSGRWLGIIHLPCWLTTANRLPGLIGVVVLGTLLHVVTRLPTLEACHSVSARSGIGSWSTIGLGRCMLLGWARRLIGWPRSELGWQSCVWNPHPALLGTRAG